VSEGRGRWLLAGLVVLAAFELAIHHRGQDSHVRINDHLDGFVPLCRMLAEREPVLGGLHDRVPALFGGLPRNSLPGTLNVGVLLYYALDPFPAHVVNDAIFRLVAFTGLFLLLARLLPRGRPWVACGTALAFALLPFLPGAHLSVAGMPLLLHAVLGLRERARPWHFGVAALFAVYSSLFFVGVFVLLALGLLFVHDWARQRRPNGPLMAAGLLMAVLYAGSEYRILYQMLFATDYVSHRSEFVRVKGPLAQVLKGGLLALVANHRHAPAVQSPFLLAALAAGLLAGALELRRPGSSLARALRGDGPEGSRWAALCATSALCVAVAAFVGFWQWTPIQGWVETTRFAPIRMFNFHRVQWFLPLLFYLGLGFALHELARRGRAGRALAGALLAAQLAWVGWNHDAFRVRREEGLSFRAYYSPALFAQIRDAIGAPQTSYRVVSLGLTPAIALYNGFQVLDGFVNDYPLAYKRAFRRVIAPELEKDPALRKHFDEWGGHVDLLSSELGTVSGYGKRLYTKDAPLRAVRELELDTTALRELGADYVISAVEIQGHEELGLRLEGVFERDDSPWQIYLYSL
jgi:hypothetical protein